jgi:hypothetical protein
MKGKFVKTHFNTETNILMPSFNSNNKKNIEKNIKDVSSQSCKAGSGFGGGRSQCQSYAAKEKKTNPAEV